MKRTLALALGTALMFGSTAMADPIKFGVDPAAYPPFTTLQADGSWAGWEVDMLAAVCKQAALECEMVPTAWDGIIPALTAGQIDVIMSSMSITEERAKVIDFSDKYYNTPTLMMVAKGSGLTPTPEAMAGKTIGVIVSTTQEAYVQAHYPDATLNSYQTPDESYSDLSAGRIDAVVSDSLVGNEWLATETGMACCESAGNVPDDPAILGKGAGFGLRQGDPLKDTLNAAIAAIRADGTYDAITKKYFTFDIYGE
jgi:polar amino acid transport system substrate-binding protein